MNPINIFLTIIAGLLLTVPGYMVIDRLTDNELTGIVSDLADLVGVIILNSPQIIAGIIQMFLYFTSVAGFFLFHLHYIFIVIQLFFIGSSVNIHDPIEMIKHYLKLNKDLIMFIVGLVDTFINIFIRIGTMIGNYIPGT